MGPLTSSYVLCGYREANEGKLFELSPLKRVEKGRSDSSTKQSFRDEAKPKRSTWRGGPSILNWKEASGGIMGRLQEALLRRLDKSLIECLLLSEDFLLHLKGGGKLRLGSFLRPTTT